MGGGGSIFTWTISWVIFCVVFLSSKYLILSKHTILLQGVLYGIIIFMFLILFIFCKKMFNLWRQYASV